MLPDWSASIDARTIMPVIGTRTSPLIPVVMPFQTALTIPATGENQAMNSHLQTRLVEFHVDGLSEITWWVIGYGDQVRVLSPDSLRERIRQIAENVVKINQNA